MLASELLKSSEVLVAGAPARVGWFISPTPSDSAELQTLLEQGNAYRNCSLLSGRSGVMFGELSSQGPVVLKPYLRGGLLRKVLRDGYFEFSGEGRAAEEGRMLRHVRSLGVNAPMPVAYIRTHGYWHRNWLLMKEIPQAKSIVQLSGDDGEVERVISEACKQVGILIANRILHSDLHPGNVVCGDGGVVYLIDFDKCIKVTYGWNKLRDYYLCRWRRAVLKYNLAESIIELFAHNLLLYRE